MATIAWCVQREYVLIILTRFVHPRTRRANLAGGHRLARLTDLTSLHFVSQRLGLGDQVRWVVLSGGQYHCELQLASMLPMW
mmetsp:Transcript_21212/g.46158  ORF Transcript_21212/g.46158 Transcript_21212/m.46158 type:complete len:82 (-) Transcript_21212:303-548(-)